MAGFLRFNWSSTGTPTGRRGLFGYPILVSGILLCAPVARPCAAQDAPEAPAAAEDVQPEISRQEWLDRIQEARRRAREVALERRMHPERYAPGPEDAARIASERALNDNSLQPGDVVATDKGLFVFRGRLDQHPSSEDFIQLPDR
ncbi:hypothetical protein [Bradyrhizobium sp. dw_78]|uniref:hypothetical protein n=1 Tax=Bradyrhizobium sp. dw_78 TaxID=2719793 RepID=UPI00201BBAB2|nr:hypothetical protein [Bradyrhizobium sp. dw_78]